MPPAQNDALLREIDDAVRQDAVTNFWKSYGLLVAGLIVAGLLAFGGWLLWQNHTETQAEDNGERYAAALTKAASGQADNAALTGLADAGQPGYRAGALLIQAGVKAEKKDYRGAIAAYKAIAADSTLAQPYRDLALIRQTALEFDSLPPQTVIDRLKPLAEAGNPWFGSAGEMSALAYAKLGKRDLAGALFAAIAKDANVPRTIQTRAVQMASLMGVDAEIAPRPGEMKDATANAQ